MLRNNLLLTVTLGLLGACAQVTVFGHKVNDGPAAPAPVARKAGAAAPDAAQQLAQPPIKRVAIEFTPAAQKQVAADERFNPDAVRDAVLAELGSRQLLDLQNPGGGRVAVIQLDEFSVHATSNVVLFGHLPSAGLLSATVRIREASAGEAATGEAREFHVRAEIPLNISQSGKEKKPLQKLYSGFASQLVDDLTGTAPRLPQRP